MNTPLLRKTPAGLYCEVGDFYIDPDYPVPKAIISHGHSDHARSGMGQYITHHLTIPVLYERVRPENEVTSLEYGESIFINGVEVTLFPAGHVPGSAQVRVSYRGEIWVFSGDYKVNHDYLSTPFEPVPCHTFISECTFGLPIFSWQSEVELGRALNQFFAESVAMRRNTIVFAYALGKAQRILSLIDQSIGPVFTHGAVHNLNEVLRDPLRKYNVNLPPASRMITSDSGRPRTKERYEGVLCIAPPSALGSPWCRRFEPYRTCYASGWMTIRGIKKRYGVDTGLILSDHADFRGLIDAIRASGCERVLLTHGYTESFGRYLRHIGMMAETL
jgi:putative mRNA 3-end processing factor